VPYSIPDKGYYESSLPVMLSTWRVFGQRSMFSLKSGISSPKTFQGTGKETGDMPSSKLDW